MKIFTDDLDDIDEKIDSPSLSSFTPKIFKSFNKISPISYDNFNGNLADLYKEKSPSFRSFNKISPHSDNLSIVNDKFNISYNKIPEITVCTRIQQDDKIIKIINFFIFALIIIIIYYTTTQISLNISNTFNIINLVFISLFFILNIFWIYYKIQLIFIGIYKLLMNLSALKKNSKYYSGLEIPDDCCNQIYFPHITIQIPIYKENLENTIIPTISSALYQAHRYENETEAICNIIVCDDGLNLIGEEEKRKRLDFYSKYNLGVTARPCSTKYKRHGRFKKAGNLNFSLNCSKSDKLDQLVELGAIFEGNIEYGSYVFLIDSDTRLPNFADDENGCLKRMVKDFMYDGENSVLYMQCFTSPYLSINSLSEKCVFHFTCHIYNGILIGTSINLMAPLFGHNALINMKLLDEIAVEKDNYKYFWSEDKISEDFDCMLRGCEKGYYGRYLSSSGIFLEGISFNYMTEYFKVSKFACGAAELTFNPISKWYSKGIISSDIIRFIMCQGIEWYNKLGIIAYIFNFIAIAQSHFALFYNLMFFDKLLDILPWVLIPINLMWEGLFIWFFLNTTINVIFAYKVEFNIMMVLRQQIRELFFTSSLYGSLSARFSIMYFVHLFGINFSFGATQKDDSHITLYDWIKSTKYEFILYNLYLIAILIRIFVFPVNTMMYTFYFGGLPLLVMIFWYWFGIIAYDILPIKKNKVNVEKYDFNDKLFIDKYKTQIPNSQFFKK
jgi:hypothetical protein